MEPMSYQEINMDYFETNLSFIQTDYHLQHNNITFHRNAIVEPYNCESGYGCFLRYSILWTLALCAAYLCVFFVGLVGNVSVLWIIISLRRTHKHSVFSTCNKVFNGLIGNLALADLLVVIFCMPPTLISNIFRPWILGRFVCKAVPYLQGVSVSASVYTLVAISADRFYGIYYPFNNGFSFMVRRTTISFIWIISFILAIPWILYFDLVPIPHNHNSNISVQTCTDVWPNESASQTYFLAVNLGLQYLFPLSIVVFFYLLLFIKIWRRKMPKMMRQRSDDTLNNWNTRIVEKSKIKVLKMLVAIVSLFALSWLPVYAIFARIKFGPPFDENSFEGMFIMKITPLAQWLGASNSCVNPILYFFFNAKFRTYFKRTIRKNLFCIHSTIIRKKEIKLNSNETHV